MSLYSYSGKRWCITGDNLSCQPLRGWSYSEDFIWPDTDTLYLIRRSKSRLYSIINGTESPQYSRRHNHWGQPGQLQREGGALRSFHGGLLSAPRYPRGRQDPSHLLLQPPVWRRGISSLQVLLSPDICWSHFSASFHQTQANIQLK